MARRTVKDKKPLNSLKLPLKKLDEQVIVLTGSTSGIGLVTARMAAKTGAKLVISGRDEDALRTLAEELSSQGAQVVYVKADVSKEEDVNRLAQKAIEAFGGFDTWINNAAAAVYGHVTDIPIEVARKLFDINYWGVVYGSLAAVRHFKEKDSPGALINVGSVAGNRAFPLQGTYSSSKFAAHSFTDALRMEVEKDQLPVVVTQIHPARVDTPYTDHAASYIDKAPTHDAMMYPPESVAEAILYAAEKPQRDMYVGGQAKMLSLMGTLMPRVTDRYMEHSVYPTNYDAYRDAESPDMSTLQGKGEELRERGTNKGWTRKGSWMVKMKKHPLLTAFAIAFGAGFLLLWIGMAVFEDPGKKHKRKKAMMKKKRTLMCKKKKAMKKAMMKRKKAMLKHRRNVMMMKHPKKTVAVKHPKIALKMAEKHGM